MDCAAPRHDHGEPETAETEAFLCRPCRVRMSRQLRRLPLLYGELDLTPGRSRGRGRGQGEGLPYSDQVSECRSQIRHDLAWWTAHWAADRRAPLPEATVPAMAGYLYGGVRMITFRIWAGDLAGAISHDYGRAMALLDPSPPKRFPAYAACPECGDGQLVCVIYDEQDKRRPVVSCDSCDKSWTGDQWIRLGQRILSSAVLAA